MANVDEEGFESVIENETGDALVSEVLGIPLIYKGSSGTSLIEGWTFSSMFGLPTVFEGRTGVGDLMDGRTGFGDVK
jgi:hypothetical protein